MAMAMSRRQFLTTAAVVSSARVVGCTWNGKPNGDPTSTRSINSTTSTANAASPESPRDVDHNAIELVVEDKAKLDELRVPVTS